MTRTAPTLIATPPLENGDHLTRAEFERRYEAMPKATRAELIEGVVHMASPVHNRRHGVPHARVMTWLGAYVAAVPQVELTDNATVRLDAENEVQPDALLRLEPELGGRSRVTEDDFIEGAPELIVEIAASSVSYDLREKLRVYRRTQVQEYVVWRVYDKAVDWFRLERGEYIPLQSADGIVRSQVFPGLWLLVDALLADDMAAVLRTLQDAVDTAEFKAFVRKLGDASHGHGG